jgi:hypothetical protein
MGCHACGRSNTEFKKKKSVQSSNSEILISECYWLPASPISEILNF